MSRLLVRSAGVTATAIGIAAAGLALAGTAAAAPDQSAADAVGGGPASAPETAADRGAAATQMPTGLPSYGTLPTSQLPVELPGLSSPLDTTSGLAGISRGSVPSLATDDALGELPVVSRLPGMEITALPVVGDATGESAPAADADTAPAPGGLEGRPDSAGPGRAEAQRPQADLPRETVTGADLAAMAAEEEPTVRPGGETETIVREDVAREGTTFGNVTTDTNTVDERTSDDEVVNGVEQDTAPERDDAARDSALSGIDGGSLFPTFG